jgi:hypothetical protein
VLLLGSNPAASPLLHWMLPTQRLREVLQLALMAAVALVIAWFVVERFF